MKWKREGVGSRPRSALWIKIAPRLLREAGTVKPSGCVATIRKQIEDTTSDYDREKLEERLAKLAGGVAVVKVGAPTETAMKEIKMRVEDALNATKAAAQEGTVIGGGVALLRAAQVLDKLSTDDGDARRGSGS